MIVVARVMKTQTEKKQGLAKKSSLVPKENHGSGSVETQDGIAEIVEFATMPPSHSHELRVDISAADRKKYESEFLKKAKSSSGTISCAQLAELLGPGELDLGVTKKEIEAQIHQMLTRTNFAGKCDFDHLNLEFFLSLISSIPKKTQNTVINTGTLRMSRIPIDPDSTLKQCWDAFCLLLLLYCSFSVPYGIAFLNDTDASISDMEISSLVVDMIFILDIFLSFVTAIEIDGIMVRDIRAISGVYLRSWFFPDFAGSFPFDTVIAAILENEHDLNSSNFLRFLKFIRMLKLIRAIKFVNKMNKLKQQEGFEVHKCIPNLSPNTPHKILHFPFVVMFGASDPL